jgi:hypothetical protein
LVLSDVAGERLKRLDFAEIFPTGAMTYVWREKTYTYTFQTITNGQRISNQALHVDGTRIVQPVELNKRLEDVIMLILFGATALGANIPDEIGDKCIIGTLIGQSDALSKFVRQRYIWVSRITRGATANSMGQIAQNYVLDALVKALPNWEFRRDSTVPGISHNQGATETHFDVVAKSPTSKYIMDQRFRTMK